MTSQQRRWLGHTFVGDGDKSALSLGPYGGLIRCAPLGSQAPKSSPNLIANITPSSSTTWGATILRQLYREEFTQKSMLTYQSVADGPSNSSPFWHI